MKKENLKIFQLAILFFGIVVISLAWTFAPKTSDAEAWRTNYMWASILAAYVALFFPMCFFPRDKDSSGGVFVSGGMYFASCVFFVAACVAFGVLVKCGIFKALYFPLLIQGVLCFFFLIEVFLCAATSNHISQVAKIENEKTRVLNETKKMSQSVSILAESLGEERAALKSALFQIANDLRYVSPSQNHDAKNLEERILALLKEISSDPIFTLAEASSENAEKKSREISVLLKQRKAMY